MADKKSFVENVNIIANGIQAAEGDIIEDANLAKNAAEKAAAEAKSSADQASLNEAMSKEWAERAYNSPIPGYPNHFSSFHWSEISKQNSGSAVIFDNTISKTQTWSSYYINNLLNLKSDKTHNHDAEYERRFTKNSAFNKNFGGTGSSTSVARSDHNHNGDYEPKISYYGTAFNKNFGTASGDVAEGSHNHDGLYMPAEAKKTAYNKDFGTTIDTVAAGNHTHEAVNIGYDNSNSKVITSTQAQGAIDQLDNLMGMITIAEKTYMTAGYSVTTEIPIAGQDTPVAITVPVAVLYSKNALLTNGASINVQYPVAETPQKKIEGTLIVTISTTNIENLRMSVAVDGTEVGEGVIGKDTLTISKYLTGLNENGFIITPMIANTENTNNVFITSMAISWEGEPQGAIVMSGTSISHNATTSRSDPNSHPIGAITGLQTELDTKANKPAVIVNDNFTLMDVNGNLKDSGFSKNVISTLVPKVSPATLDNIAILQTDGTLKDSGYQTSNFANKTGDPTINFDVGIASADTHAVRKRTLDDIVATLATLSDLQVHTNDTNNPHSVTAVQVGAAPTIHTHSQADVAGLTDSLNTKYDKVSGAVQNNIPLFDTIGTLKDSGVSLASITPPDYTMTIGNINDPLLDIPFNNSLNIKQGVGQVTFARATTATYIDRYGVLSAAAIDEPRFEKEGLLLEGASTNLELYGDMQSSWLQAKLTLAYNAAIDPAGGNKAMKATVNTDGIAYLYRSNATTAGVTYTQSYFVKNISTDGIFIVSMHSNTFGTTKSATFDLNAGTVTQNGTTQASLIKLNDGWFRLTASAVAAFDTVSDAVGLLYKYNAVVGQEFLAYGAQLEEMPFATSYIPTNGATVTRTSEECSVQYVNNCVAHTSPSSVAVDFKIPEHSVTQTLFNSNYRFTSYISNGGTVSSSVGTESVMSKPAYLQLPMQGMQRVTATFDGSRSKLYMDGAKLIDVSNTYAIMSPFSSIFFGSSVSWTYPMYGHIRNVRVWDRALTEEEAKLA